MDKLKEDEEVDVVREVFYNYFIRVHYLVITSDIQI